MSRLSWSNCRAAAVMPHDVDDVVVRTASARNESSDSRSPPSFVNAMVFCFDVWPRFSQFTGVLALFGTVSAVRLNSVRGEVGGRVFLGSWHTVPCPGITILVASTDTVHPD